MQRLLPVPIGLLAMIFAGPAFCSEGLLMAGAYACEPVRVTAALAEHCVQREPALSKQYPNALRDWKRRNGAAAEELQAECRAKAKGASASEAEYGKFMQFVRTTNDKTIEAKAAEYAGSAVACGEFLRELSSGSEDLHKFLEKKK
ncbi:hypothetical protein [Pelomonas sp. SE-A7]|uniref:hypothetical protein n=1 Tax=Pelomonas sp. SE-A7 TaxID=3054953 RepID=UPI00259CD3C8|nr:hypothetical protein [Pelomonas sp. SE-A7]MDM4768561.1 hypothetical protein [Pelomonas sp. SE-A7]